MKVIIIGAGMAGSIAAGALSGYNPVVIESGPENVGGLSSHHAVMRMRSPDVTKYLGCDSTEVMVNKAIFCDGKLHDKPSISMNNLYSMKAYGQLGTRSLNLLGPVKRYLIDDPSKIKPSNVLYGHTVSSITKDAIVVDTKHGIKAFEYDVCISTIPMWSMSNVCDLDWCGMPIPCFDSKPIFVVTSEFDSASTVHQTIYFPEHKFNIYRATLEGKRFIAESISGWDDEMNMYKELNEVAGAFGLSMNHFSIPDVSTQRMGKVMPIPDNVRRWVILELTNKFNIYSFGRFALWRPIRTDNLVGDIEKIKRFIKIGDMERFYEAKLSHCIGSNDDVHLWHTNVPKNSG